MRVFLPLLLLVGLVGLAEGKPHPPKPAPVPPPLFLPDGQPNVAAVSAIAIDAQSGKVLWAKDAESPRFMASTTKIMTAMLLIEHCKLDEVVVAPADITKTGESSMHLKPGEKVKVQDMLYALMLRSANDGCVAVADHVAGSVPKFVDMMNARAAQIGCKHTHFNNPNGLPDPNHFTSAHDLAMIAREAMRLSEFRQVVKTWKYEIGRSVDQKDRWMINRNKWLQKDVTADGIKTGFTKAAGHCYVGSATRGNWRVITVVLNSNHWQLDHDALLSYAFKNYEPKTFVQPGATIASVAVTAGAAPSVPVGVDKPVVIAERKGNPPTSSLGKMPSVTAPVAKGAELGDVLFSDGDGFAMPIKVRALDSVPVPPPLAVGKGPLGLALVAGAFAVASGVYAWKRRAKRKMGSYA